MWTNLKQLTNEPDMITPRKIFKATADFKQDLQDTEIVCNIIVFVVYIKMLYS